MSERPPGVTDELLAEVGRAIGGALITRETMFVAAERALEAAAPAIRAQAAAAERECIRQLLLSDQATEAAANASDEWFGKDQDLKFGLSEVSKAQARVELAAVADLIGGTDA
jgi:hypothetical protein